MDVLASQLAKQAHELGLDAINVTAKPPETVLAFAQFVLDELAARGLVTGEADLGCWAEPRTNKN